MDPAAPGAGASGSHGGAPGTRGGAPGGASGAADQGQGAAAGAAQQAQEKVSEVAGQAQEQARTTLRSQVAERSTQAGEQVVSQASDVRTVGEELRKQGKEGPAKVAEQAADRAERVGGYLRDSDADTILNDVENYARNSPWTVVAGGLAAGFVASRFLKASSTDRYRGVSRYPAPAGRRLPARTVSPTPRPLGAPPTTPPTTPPVGTPPTTPPVGAPPTPPPGSGTL